MIIGCKKSLSNCLIKSSKLKTKINQRQISKKEGDGLIGGNRKFKTLANKLEENKKC